jgi:hypothetical protein
VTRVALLGGAPAAALARGLRSAGHEAQVIDAGPLGIAETVLDRRGFTGPLSHLPRMVAALHASDAEVVHAFGAPEAAAALAWRRLRPRPVVFTCVEVLDRSTVADRRLRLRLLTAALEQTAAVTAASEEAGEGVARWFAIDAPVLAPDDAAEYAALYERLVAR